MVGLLPVAVVLSTALWWDSRLVATVQALGLAGIGDKAWSCSLMAGCRTVRGFTRHRCLLRTAQAEWLR